LIFIQADQRLRPPSRPIERRKGRQVMKYILFNIAVLILTVSVVNAEAKTAEIDRLDGKGPSGKRIEVIEWKGNLEIHVYPKGSLLGLSLKKGQVNGKSTLTIGYRLNHSPEKKIFRTTVLKIPLKNRFYTFQDYSTVLYDKILISNAPLNKKNKNLIVYRPESNYTAVPVNLNTSKIRPNRDWIK